MSYSVQNKFSSVFSSLAAPPPGCIVGATIGRIIHTIFYYKGYYLQYVRFDV